MPKLITIWICTAGLLGAQPQNVEFRKAYESARMTLAEAQLLEDSVARGKDELRGRARLVVYYAMRVAEAKDRFEKESAESAKVRHIAAMVELDPRSPLWEAPVYRVPVGGGDLPSQMTFADVRRAWLLKAAEYPDDVKVACNAARAMHPVEDMDEVARLLRWKEKLDVNCGAMLGQVYARRILDEGGVRAAEARANLLATKERSVLIAASTVLTGRVARMKKLGEIEAAEAEELEAFAAMLREQAPIRAFGTSEDVIVVQAKP